MNDHGSLQEAKRKNEITQVERWNHSHSFGGVYRGAQYWNGAIRDEGNS
jgi:hypothetical protein